MDLIKRDVKTFQYANSINDNCYLALIDSLTERFIRTSDVQYMECLELISSVRDGYVAEYFPEIGKNLYYCNFAGFIDFIYSKKNSSFNPMENVFIEAVAEEIYLDKNGVNLSKYFKSQIKKNELDKEKKKYLSNLIEKAKKYVEKLR